MFIQLAHNLVFIEADIPQTYVSLPFLLNLSDCHQEFYGKVQAV